MGLRESFYFKCLHGRYPITEEVDQTLREICTRKNAFIVGIICKECKEETVISLVFTKGSLNTRTTFIYKPKYGDINRTMLPNP